MHSTLKRREFLELAGLASAGIAGVVFTAGLHPARAAAASRTREDDFMFLQMCPTRIGDSRARPSIPMRPSPSRRRWPV
jgi:hypothetical protein